MIVSGLVLPGLILIGIFYPSVLMGLPIPFVLIVAELASHSLMPALMGEQIRKQKREEDERTHYRWPLAVVLAEHRLRVEKFRAAGHILIPCTSLDDYPETQSAHERQPYCRVVLVVCVCLALAFKLAILGVGPLLLWWFDVSEPLPLAAALAADCLLMSLLPRSWWPSVKHAHHLGLLEPPSSQAADSNLDNAAL